MQWGDQYHLLIDLTDGLFDFFDTFMIHHIAYLKILKSLTSL